MCLCFYALDDDTSGEAKDGRNKGVMNDNKELNQALFISAGSNTRS